jgi:probable rRNA maturation factor
MDTSRSIWLPPFRIDITTRDGVRVTLSAAGLARIAARVLEVAGAPTPASISLILSNDAELASLNAKHMDEHGPTDVLSFPMLPPSAFPPHPGQRAGTKAARDVDFVTPAGRRQELGDIVISVERAAAQARDGRGGQNGDKRWSVADELRLLVIHGVLHVCGWDHADADERDAMRALETDLLNEGATD